MKLISKKFLVNSNKKIQFLRSTNFKNNRKNKTNLYKLSIVVLSFLLSSYLIIEEPKFTIKGISSDKKYGYIEEKPIKVGGGTTAGYHFFFLKHLRGPNGEALDVIRIGSCGSYPNPDSSLTKYDEGVLTCFSINCPSFKRPKTLYFDKYRTGDLYIPKDLTWKE
jgi:hypothetical protein